MHNWSPEQWTAILTAVIGSLAAAAVSIIAALQGRAMSAKLDRHAAAEQHRHTETLAVLGQRKD